MERFRSGQLDVLVATTVIEVGVDVPNATVMVILDADRFGIAQLHQLRGRVGARGDRSWCFLVGAGTTPDGERRLHGHGRHRRRVRPGRGRPRGAGRGHVFDSRQKGRTDLKLASLLRDRAVVEQARAWPSSLVGADPGLADAPRPPRRGGAVPRRGGPRVPGAIVRR